MKLFINGEEMIVPDDVTNVEQLLAYFKLNNKVGIVERNQVIVDRSLHAEEAVTNEDRIEIVQFVGGG
ncbi:MULTISPECIES: sulfur carrier protein ThiS [Halobacillus]|uniref:ThiS protein n=1 Tax=Halobacillus halophilus (strain ATCC 35676 / DSM 2266 / JCM 20832 / KCTC 3685 / LMG 17431 / NBRC 102448 / NCIMB 2269) TaxID=866895 RepID=I0JNP4_HALH3|nr:sulfur carrier protein ThiS [Halobacillus halophilus]ASF39812.1 thiamine biosynthesis protein ThiS [Halobacillus halophilus]CCG45764.1 ThiS protein [Halobacillus halophilus DSM 2266]